MGILAKKGGADIPGENVAWVAISDMMLGMFIVFLTLFVVALTGFSDSAAQEKEKQIEIISDIVKELQTSDVENITVDRMTGDLKITDMGFFDSGSAVLNQRGKDFLNALLPKYLNTVFGTPSMIDKVEAFVIQGHTDSTGSGTPMQVYLKNLELSAARAASVAAYVYETDFDKQYQEKIMKMMTVEGRSHSDPIINPATGLEDQQKSRRVELRLRTKKVDIMDLLLGVSRQ